MYTNDVCNVRLGGDPVLRYTTKRTRTDVRAELPLWIWQLALTSSYVYPSQLLGSQGSDRSFLTKPHNRGLDQRLFDHGAPLACKGRSGNDGVGTSIFEPCLSEAFIDSIEFLVNIAMQNWWVRIEKRLPA